MSSDPSPPTRPLRIIAGAIRTPPMTTDARREAGFLLRRLQHGESLAMPHSRPMPAIGPRCHELRIPEEGGTWRLFYRVDPDAIVVAEVLKKKTRATPRRVIATVQERFRSYDASRQGEEEG